MLRAQRCSDSSPVGSCVPRPSPKLIPRTTRTKQPPRHPTLKITSMNSPKIGWPGPHRNQTRRCCFEGTTSIGTDAAAPTQKKVFQSGLGTGFGLFFVISILKEKKKKKLAPAAHAIPKRRRPPPPPHVLSRAGKWKQRAATTTTISLMCPSE